MYELYLDVECFKMSHYLLILKKIAFCFKFHDKSLFITNLPRKKQLNFVKFRRVKYFFKNAFTLNLLRNVGKL